MSEPAQAHQVAEAPLVQIPVDLVEFEARLLALERRLSEQEARDQMLLGLAEAVRHLTQTLGPLLESIRPMVGIDLYSADARSPGPPQAVRPERLAMAQARMREIATHPAVITELSPASAPSSHALQPPLAPPFPPPGRHSWLLRALRRMVGQDPPAAGRLVAALLPAHRLAEVERVAALPGPPETVARILVRGRLRRRLGWERAQLGCDFRTVCALAKLVRLQVPPRHLHAAGVLLDPALALSLVALAIDPRWTAGHSFAIAHFDASSTYLEVRDGALPSVTAERPAVPVTTTVRCPRAILLPLLAGEDEAGVTVDGERRQLEFVQQWFSRAGGA